MSTMKHPSSPTVSQLAILPGLLCDSRMFQGQARGFPGTVVVDGYYAGCRSLAEMADYALARLPASFSLLGHSMGARIALEIVRKSPERVERLALSDTGVHPLGPGERERRYALRDIGRTKGMAALVAEWLPPMLAPSNVALIELLTPMCVEAGQAGYERQIEALLSRPGVDDVLRVIACPTLVIVGALDAWSPIAQHETLAAAIEGAALRVVPGAGHMLPVEASDAFNHEIAQWLARPISSRSNPQCPEDISQ